MLFKLHYFLIAAGYNASGILLGVYMSHYTDAQPAEIGLLYMLMPFIGTISRPIVGSFADRKQAHQKYLMLCLGLAAISYVPFILVPTFKLNEQNPRFCWYFLVACTIFGDVSSGCACSIADSLAVNYSRRTATGLGHHRVGGTISWMLFGLITGQLNEAHFLPNFVAGFIVLVLATLIELFIIYLWPSEYFILVADDATKAVESDKSSPWTRSLMPRQAIWAHAKRQLVKLVRCGSGHRPVIELRGGSLPRDAHSPPIERRVQLVALTLLLRRNANIIGYMLIFMAAGASLAPVNFFFMSLAETCRIGNRCEFSHLVGAIQVFMSVSETICLVFIRRIVRKIGQVSTLALAFGLAAVKFLFYATIFQQVNPNYAILSEMLLGFTFGIYIISINEMSHTFALQVKHLTPELIERGLIASDDLSGQRKLELALPATMQSLFAAFYHGLGHGLSALIYGLIVDQYSYRTLWLVVGSGSLMVCAILLTANLLDRCCCALANFKRDATIKLEMAPEQSVD